MGMFKMLLSGCAIFVLLFTNAIYIPSIDFPPRVAPARAVVGNIAIWRDNTSDSIPSTVGQYVKATFENEDRNDGTFTKDAEHDDFDIQDSGRYLVTYLLRGTVTHNNRANFKGRITINGSAVEGTYSQSYVRNNGNNDFFVRGYGVLDISAGDDIALEWTRDTGAGTSAGALTSDASELMIVRLPDSSSAAYAHYSDGASTASDGGTSWNTLGWNTNEYQTDTSVIEKQAGDTSVRLKKVARYLVIYSASYKNSSSARTQRISQATLGGSALKQSHSYTYLRNSQDEFGVVAAMFVVDNASANQDLTVQVQRGTADSDGSVARMTNESGLFVVELPASAETLIAHDGTGAQNVAGAGANITVNVARDQDQRDAASFTLPSTTQVQVKKTADYLFTANIKLARSGTSGSRLSREIRWEVNDVDQARGRHGTYLRGNQSTTDTYEASLNPSMIMGLSADDIVEAEIFDVGDDGSSPNDKTVANEAAITAINLDTLVASAAVSISLDTNGAVAFGYVDLDATVDTTASGVNDVETISVDSGPADLALKSTTFSDGGNTWALGATTGSDQAKWDFSSDGSSWSTFTSADTLYTLENSVAESSTQSAYFRLTMPSSTSSLSEHSTTVTIQASAP